VAGGPAICHTPHVGDPRISHRGDAYGVGRDEGYYGVWDLRAGGEPVASYELTPEGWVAAWERYRELEGGFGVPRWRSTGPGWVLLHLLIGLAFWFLAAVLAVIVLEALGRDIDDETTGLAALGALLPVLVGWYLFVYLPISKAVRGLVLVLTVLVGAGIVFLAGYVGQPTA
jgi:hypothetical protein